MGFVGLVVLDVDSTLVATEGIDLLAELAGVGARVAAVTERAMRGELDFEASLRERVGLLRGLKVTAIARANALVRPNPGALELVQGAHARGWAVGAVSGGFTDMVAPLAESLGLDHWQANRLEAAGGELTGGLVGPVVDRAAKAAALRRWASAAGVPAAMTVAVGDGANDLDMLAAAGVSVAYGGKPAVVAAARHAITGSLAQVLDLLPG